jgi:hypothetical protein
MADPTPSSIKILVLNGRTATMPDGGVPVISADQCYVAIAYGLGGVAEANARRIVALWNACEGIPTEELEKAAALAPPWDRLRCLAQAAGEAAFRSANPAHFGEKADG